MKELKKFLKEKQEPGNWLEIANTFNVEGTKKQKSDYVRRLWKKVRSEGHHIQDVEQISDGILFIGDIHEPFCKEGYLEFCKKQYDKYGCNKVIFAGDIIDNHAQSFHDSDADGLSAKDELELAVKKLQTWYKVFPKATVLIGNHDRIVARKLFKVGVSQRWLKPLGEVLEVPNWDFVEEYIYNDILYVHGEGGTARKKAQQEMMSVCQGHLHSEAYVEFLNGGKNFALQVGCGIDFESYAFAYAKRDKKPVISCAVILDKSPILIPFKND